MQGKTAGGQAPLPRKKSRLKNLPDRYRENSNSLFRPTTGKIRIALMLTDVLKVRGT